MKHLEGGIVTASTSNRAPRHLIYRRYKLRYTLANGSKRSRHSHREGVKRSQVGWASPEAGAKCRRDFLYHSSSPSVQF